MKTPSEKLFEKYKSEHYEFMSKQTGDTSSEGQHKMEWQNEGDNFTIFSLFRKGYTKLSNETELVNTNAKLEGSSR